MVKVTHIGDGCMLHQHLGERGQCISSKVFQKTLVCMGVKVAIAQSILKR